ncbi:Cysteine-rich repeat secretory protein 3 [Platanthera zijinensis]|uniref:Cysteine-rich repeat secretory protein 3 n=1 Tax=Platanthera zijinensis TaxID=2320716 RepID=A0AAP0G3C1_9ASPA
MGILPSLQIALSPLAILAVLTLAAAAADSSIFDLVYKGCANQQLTAGASADDVASTLLSQSSASKFFNTSSPDQSIYGLFQCRGDLSSSDCAACVAKAVPMWSSLCGAALAARVQLVGCYALYEVAGFPQVSGNQMLYKKCGSGSGGGEGFEEQRDTALSSLQSGVAAGRGFYATTYQSVYAMAQCEGDLSSSACGQCVEEAVQKSQVECGGANSGQVYLDKCYASYNYYPNGVPTGGGGGGSGGADGGGGKQTERTVAIVVGGAAAVGFLVICLLFARSLLKKKD